MASRESTVTLEARGLSERLTKLTLSGHLDTPGVDAIETAFVAALVPGSKSAIVDLSRLEFVASMGLRMFISVARSLRMRHAKLVLYSVPPLIGEVFENASLSEIIPIATDEAAALAAVSS